MFSNLYMYKLFYIDLQETLGHSRGIPKQLFFNYIDVSSLLSTGCPCFFVFHRPRLIVTASLVVAESGVKDSGGDSSSVESWKLQWVK